MNLPALKWCRTMRIPFYKFVFLLTAIATGTLRAEGFTCSGTEPFWDLEIGDGSYRLKESGGNRSVTLRRVTPESAQGMAKDYVLVYRTRSVDEPSEHMTIVLQKSDDSSCSDGMSEGGHPYYAVVVTQHRVLSGCCSK